ncbi:MAG: arrestin family protein [Myxococcales bacterium]|nr:arrestin family protein [Myxococcales bacterium]
MPARPTIRTYLTPQPIAAGQTLAVRFTLESTEQTKVDYIDVVLVGTESRYKRTVTTGKSSHRTFHKRTAVQLGARLPAMLLEKGTTEHHVQFAIPADAPPSFRSALSHIQYSLSVRVSIPWWPDAHATYDVIVVPPSHARLGPRPLLVTSNADESRGKDPIIELSTNAGVLVPGAAFDASVALSGIGDRRIDRVTLALVAVEQANVSSSAGPLEVDRREWIVAQSAPADGASTSVRAVVPPEVVRTFSTPFISVTHALEVKAVVSWGSDLVLRTPVTVVDVEAPSLATEAPTVGRARHREVWLSAGEHLRQLGVSDAAVHLDRCEARFRVGSIAAVVREETHASLGPCIVTELSHRDLGLELRVAERAWTDFGGKIPALSAPFRKRFSCAIRDPNQATSLLDASVQETLMLFDEVGVSDQGVVALRKGGVYQPTSLQRALMLVHGLAQRLDNAVRRVAPPAMFEAHVDRWRSFAEEHAEALRPGDLAVSGWSVRGHELSIVHAFEGPKPVYTTIRATIARRGTDAEDGAMLSRATNATVVVHEGTVAMRIPLALDPGACAEPADRLAVALSALLTGASGAYR